MRRVRLARVRDARRTSDAPLTRAARTFRHAGMVEKARELAEKNRWFLCRQFETDANWRFHYDSTGPEIVNDLGGTALDYWVTGYGAFDRWLGSAPPRYWPALTWCTRSSSLAFPRRDRGHVPRGGKLYEQ